MRREAGPEAVKPAKCERHRPIDRIRGMIRAVPALAGKIGNRIGPKPAGSVVF
jgi:hypothetical protein